MFIPNGLAVFILVFHLKFIQDMAKATASGTVIPEHNMSMHPISLHTYFNYFDVTRNVTARVGQTTFLTCKVEQLGDKSVSWIRKRDLHILTAGVLTYTSDERFQVIRPERSDRWTLQIKYPQMRDAGIYECQVNTEPKMFLPFRLNVVEAKAMILGPKDIYVKQGSEVALTCTVSQGPHELGQILWLRGKSIIDPKTSYHLNDIFEYPDRVTISTESGDVLQSRLTISTARLTDSGNYSCMPTTAEGTSAIVHVINEAKAMILGPKDIYVKQGSEVALTCTVSQGPHELGQILWLRGKSIIDPKTSYHLNDIFEYPDRVTISTESGDVLQSRLTISTARLTDSGNYSCMPTTAEGTSAIVHVINGEHPAAMQRGCANNNINLSILLYILSLSLLIQYLNRILSTFIVLHVISPRQNSGIINAPPFAMNQPKHPTPFAATLHFR